MSPLYVSVYHLTRLAQKLRAQQHDSLLREVIASLKIRPFNKVHASIQKESGVTGPAQGEGHAVGDRSQQMPPLVTCQGIRERTETLLRGRTEKGDGEESEEQGHGRQQGRSSILARGWLDLSWEQDLTKQGEARTKAI